MTHPGDRDGGATVIECGTCAMRETDHCRDCVVSFIVNREPGDAVVVDAEEARALRRLADAGLVPRDRHVPVTWSSAR